MIERYSRPKMKALWSDQRRFETWLKVELAVVDYYVHTGKITVQEQQKLHQATFTLERIAELESLTRHDVIAFTRAVSESLGDEARWIHYGLTSTDVIDTALGVTFKEVNTILREGIQALKSACAHHAITYKDTPCIGRTHGIHADITSFGLKFALWYDELTRHEARFDAAAHAIEVGKISGAVGTFAHTSPQLQDFVCQQLGIQSSAISTQVIQRDVHAHYISVLALIATTCEKIGLEIRHLQRSEVSEVEEGFAKSQKGSSAMPHKRNPIASENLAGCARIMRGYSVSAYENIALWHERDISHSSAERIMLPDATILLDYMLARTYALVENLVVFEQRMMDNIYTTHGVIFAQRVMNLCIERHGLTREAAYDKIQPLAMQSWAERSDFKRLCLAYHILSEAEIEEAWDVRYHLAYVDEILRRVGIL